MARPGKIWWNKDRQAWYSTVGGKKTRLAEDRDKAQEVYHQLKAKEGKVPEEKMTVDCIFALYLDFIKTHSPTTYPSYQHTLGYFLKFYPDKILASDLRASHMERWFEAHPQWSDSTKNLYVSIVNAALSWATKPERRYISVNPLSGLEKPHARSRGAEVLFTEEDFQKLLDGANPQTRDMLIALRQTGMRPSSLCLITRKCCDFTTGIITLQRHKTKRKTGRPLHIPMSSTMRELCLKLCEKHPEGPLFRTRRGRPWNSHHIGQTITKLRRRVGASENIVGYAMRHNLATQLLQDGVEPTHVATILGHSSLNMLFRHYSHLSCFNLPLGETIDRTLGKEKRADSQGE